MTTPARLSAVRWLTALVLTTQLATPAAAQDAPAAEAARRGRELAEEADRRDRGYGDFQARMEMILRSADGDEARRDLRVSVLEVDGGGERSMLVFDSPRDIRGTALLTFSRPGRENQQWLYLPALRRTKRISATGRSSPFMGSEFTYEDLVRAPVEDYDYRYLGEEDLEGVRVWLVERVPRYDGSGYSSERLWIDTAEYRVLRIDYRDSRARELKTVTVHGYREYVDGVWKPREMRMRNLRTGASTVLQWTEYRFRTGLSERDFDPNLLGRRR